MTKFRFFGELHRFQPLEESLLEKKESIEKIGGDGSKTFKFPGDFFVKIPSHYDPNSELRREIKLSNTLIINDYLVTLMLLKRGYPVIEPYGLYEVTIPHKTLGLKRDISVPAFISKFKKGFSYEQNNKNGWSIDHENEMLKLLKNASDEGFEPGFDSEWGTNGLWVPLEQKLYLIDFEYWTGNQNEKQDLLKSLGYKW